MSEQPPSKRPKSTEGPEERSEMFEILQYPPTIQRKILNSLNSKQLFEFYISSTKARTLILTNRLEKNKRKIVVNICRRAIWISLKPLIFVSSFDDPLLEKSGLNDPKKKIIIDGFSWVRLPRDDPVKYLQNNFACKAEEMNVYKTVEWLKKIFNTESATISFGKFVESPRNYCLVDGFMRFSESSARMIQEKFPIPNQISREKKENFLVSMLKHPEIIEFEILKCKRLPVSRNPAVIARQRIEEVPFVNYILKLLDIHCGPGVRKITIIITKGANVNNMFKKIKRITNIEEILGSDELIAQRRGLRNAIDFRTKTGKIVTCEVTDDKLTLTIWD